MQRHNSSGRNRYSKFASSIRTNIACEAKQIGDEFVNSAGRRARAFRMSYQYENENENEKEGDDELTNEKAKTIHREVYGDFAKRISRG